MHVAAGFGFDAIAHADGSPLVGHNRLAQRIGDARHANDHSRLPDNGGGRGLGHGDRRQLGSADQQQADSPAGSRELDRYLTRMGMHGRVLYGVVIVALLATRTCAHDHMRYAP